MGQRGVHLQSQGNMSSEILGHLLASKVKLNKNSQKDIKVNITIKNFNYGSLHLE